MEGWFLFGIEPWKGVAHSADNNNSQTDYLGRSWPLFMDSVTTVSSNSISKLKIFLIKGLLTTFLPGNAYYELFPTLASSGIEVRAFDQR